MQPGTFALLVTDFDAMENREPLHLTSHPLEASTFDEALKQAVTKWNSLPRYNPGNYADNQEYPQNPRLLYQL
jgi:hypothetical protein